MRISDWSSDVCSSDLRPAAGGEPRGQPLGHENRAMAPAGAAHRDGQVALAFALIARQQVFQHAGELVEEGAEAGVLRHVIGHRGILSAERLQRSEEHTSELQSLMRTSYAVFCLKKQ